MVEFALILPIFLAIVCGIMDFGWLFYNQILLDNVCRECARDIVVRAAQPTAYIEDKAMSTYKVMLKDRKGLSDPEFKFEWSSTLGEPVVWLDWDDESISDKTMGDARVTITSQMAVFTPIGSFLFADVRGGTVKTISAEVIMKVEYNGS